MCTGFNKSPRLFTSSVRSTRPRFFVQPFGINTPGAFAFVNAILIPVYFTKGAEMAWKVGVAANFFQGCIEVSLAVVGPLIQRVVPMVALLTSISSIGLAFLLTGTFEVHPETVLRITPIRR